MIGKTDKIHNRVNNFDNYWWKEVFYALPLDLSIVYDISSELSRKFTNFD